MMLPIGKKANRGFLLLEVMVSVAVLSIGLVLILSSFTGSIRAIDLSEDFFKAGLLFEEKIYEVSNSDAEPCSSSGTFSDFGDRFLWNLDVIKLEEESLHEVNLKVSWDRGNKEYVLSLLTYL